MAIREQQQKQNTRQETECRNFSPFEFPHVTIVCFIPSISVYLFSPESQTSSVFTNPGSKRETTPRLPETGERAGLWE